MKRIGGAALLLSSIFLISTPVSSAPAPAASAAKTRQEWTQIASDKKYGKLFSPSRVKVESSVNGVATRIGAWIKTSYTVEGARETIEAYGIEKSIPDPGKLSYSVGYVEVVPQERKLFYVKEDFYDAEGNALWSTVYEPPKEHEINHRKFEEDYYVAIVDRVFHHGEREQKDSEDRWKHLWEKQSGGRTTHAYGDMTTMRLSGDNLIYWEFQETKDSEGNTVEVHFLRRKSCFRKHPPQMHGNKALPFIGHARGNKDAPRLLAARAFKRIAPACVQLHGQRKGHGAIPTVMRTRLEQDGHHANLQ